MKKILILTPQVQDLAWEVSLAGHYPVVLDAGIYDGYGELYTGMKDNYRYQKFLVDVTDCDAAIGEFTTYAPALCYIIGFLVARGKRVVLYGDHVGMDYLTYPFNQLACVYSSRTYALEALN